MADYIDFFHDFPGRCIEVLELTENIALIKRREVTLMLSIAFPVFILPFERLKMWNPHPSGDSGKYVIESKNLNDLFGSKFCDSELIDSLKLETWKYSEHIPCIKEKPHAWQGFNDDKINNVTTKKVLSTIRNALAHGNIHTLDDPIVEIVFVSRHSMEKPEQGFDILRITPTEFDKLLKNWAKFISTIKIPTDYFDGLMDEIA